MSDQGEAFRYRGMAYYEREAVEKATATALREVREFWLPILEGWLAELERAPDTPLSEFFSVHCELNGLRRRLGIKKSDEERRAATRERVRQHRERKRQEKKVTSATKLTKQQKRMAKLDEKLEADRLQREAIMARLGLADE